MEDKRQFKLDSAVFNGRLKLPVASYKPRPTPQPSKRVEDVHNARFKKVSVVPGTSIVQYNPQPAQEKPTQPKIADVSNRPQPLVSGPMPKEFTNWLSPPDTPAMNERPAESKRSPIRPKLKLLPHTVVAAVLIAGLYVGFSSLRAHHAKAQNSVNTVVSKTNVSQASAAPDQPNLINIPFVGVQANVYPMNLSANGAFGVPLNFSDTAWDKASAKPGEPGTMIIGGHTAGVNSKGAFYDLAKLMSGDLIQITRGDGKAFNYRVTATKMFDSKTFDLSDFIRETPTKPSLILVTLNGEPIPGTSETNKQLVVYSILE